MLDHESGDFVTSPFCCIMLGLLVTPTTYIRLLLRGLIMCWYICMFTCIFSCCCMWCCRRWCWQPIAEGEACKAWRYWLPLLRLCVVWYWVSCVCLMRGLCVDSMFVAAALFCFVARRRESLCWGALPVISICSGLFLIGIGGFVIFSMLVVFQSCSL